LQVPRKIGPVVEKYIASKPAVDKLEVEMNSLSDSRERVEKEMVG